MPAFHEPALLPLEKFPHLSGMAPHEIENHIICSHIVLGLLLLVSRTQQREGISAVQWQWNSSLLDFGSFCCCLFFFFQWEEYFNEPFESCKDEAHDLKKGWLRQGPQDALHTLAKGCLHAGRSGLWRRIFGFLFFVRKGLVESESMFGDLQKEILNRTNRRNMTAELRKMVSIHGHLRKATANKHYE